MAEASRGNNFWCEDAIGNHTNGSNSLQNVEYCIPAGPTELANLLAEQQPLPVPYGAQHTYGNVAIAQNNVTDYITHMSLSDESLAIEDIEAAQNEPTSSPFKGLSSDLLGQSPLNLSSFLAESREKSADSGSVLNHAVRKSERLNFQAPTAISQEYDPALFWCDDCQFAYESECQRHRVTDVSDRPVLSRARLTLPAMLSVNKVDDGEGQEKHGVFAKRQIWKRTRFGPFVAPKAKEMDLVEGQIMFRLDLPEGPVYLSAHSEDDCNWMMFVRAAENAVQQNLVVHQRGHQLFFTTTKNIEPHAELRVWYARHYAAHQGLTTLSSAAGGNSSGGQWTCYECDMTFRSSALLDAHMTAHDNEPHQLDHHDDDPSVTFSLPRGRGRGRRRGRPAKREAQFKQPQATESRSLLQKRFRASSRAYSKEPLRRSLDTLYRRNAKAAVNEYACTQCSFVFENSRLLNLHLLSHAAERLEAGEEEQCAMNEVYGQSVARQQQPEQMQQNGEASVACNQCPVCRQTFPQQLELIKHVEEHAKPSRGKTWRPPSSNKCSKCWKSFASREILLKHLSIHGSEQNKPLQCDVCKKRFMNNSALACHRKTHSSDHYYKCPICKRGFDQPSVLRSHGETHRVDGVFHCSPCNKVFEEFNAIKKHMRALHTDLALKCTSCEKVFPRADKLRLHMLKHSDKRDYMCHICGRQFKRKDKLKEHAKRVHTANKIVPYRPVVNQSEGRFEAKVNPTDYHRFIYKCHSCLVGFKRRGMLVNHLAKRHPDISPATIPELNLPILRPQRDYMCQYCDKVYKSASKRKAHILKNHPGQSIPDRGILGGSGTNEDDGGTDAFYSKASGALTSNPFQCEYCHRQYASRAKLLQHQRDKHYELMPEDLRRPQRASSGGSSRVQGIDIKRNVVVNSDHLAFDGDLLTQAMTELAPSEGQAQVGQVQQVLEGHVTQQQEFSQTFIAPVATQTQTQTLLSANSVELNQLLQSLIQSGQVSANIQVVSGVDPTSGASILNVVPTIATAEELQKP